jgi:prepilin-type N-terminal cleavage/methylation domain-containing protein
MHKTASMRSRKLNSGFSLMELAIVLMIVGTLMSGVLVAVSQTAENNRRTNARAQLRQVEEALYGFAQATGRLPCPATDTSAGYEDITGGVCEEMHGFVPSATLDLYGQTNDDGLLLDAWQNPLRYSLVITEDSSDPGNPDFSSQTSITDFFNNGYTLDTTNMLQVCADAACSGTVLANTVPAVVLSMGADWSTYTSADETMNAGTVLLGGYPVKNDLSFVSASYAEDQFDDQLVWLSPYVLFNRLVSAGKLP